MLLVGEIMPQVFKQETTMIEHMRTSGLLDEYYIHGFGTMQSSLWLSQAVKQITDRHPHLHILEIGAGTGGATRNILRAIDQDLDSYTFTDISSSFFENAADRFALWKDRMIFKVYDVERSPVTQGFKEEGYDVVVASLVIHATAKLDNTLRNLRKLLRPGGYLIVGEGTSDGPLQSGDGFIFGALPGWWLGVEEGRTISPFVNTHKWDELLKRTGFSGIDTLAPPKFLETFGLVLFTSQAVDDQITYLRQPLTKVGLPISVAKIAKVTIIGGATNFAANLAQKIGAIFADIAVDTVFYQSLEDSDVAIFDQESTVISLVEIDTPSFKDITVKRWNVIKKIFGAGKNLLWISVGRLADMPWSNMPIGFGRTAMNETPGLHAQFLDFFTLESVDARTICESLLRLHLTGQTIDNSSGIFWTAEPEVVIDFEGRHLVPRLKSIAAANDRYNSLHHRMSKDVKLDASRLELLQTSSNSCRVIETSPLASVSNKASETLRLRTSLTVLSALKTTIGYQFLTSCVDPHGRRYLALVARTLSYFDTAKEFTVPYSLEDTGLSEIDFLTAVATCLISSVITEQHFPGQKIALHNVSPFIARAIENQASKKDIKVFCTTDALNDPSIPKSWTRLPAYTSRAEISQLLPGNLACFVGLSSKDQSENEDTILSLLSPQCRRETASELFQFEALESGTSSAYVKVNMLHEAIQNVLESGSEGMCGRGETISLTNLVNGKRLENPIAIVDWMAQQSLPVQITRLDNGIIFKADRTYWLCGMSGALGISVCDWMIDRGVKHLVITSRNPQVEQSWIEDNKRSGIDVRLMPWYVLEYCQLGPEFCLTNLSPFQRCH
jgi:SAM-dependent methyltransferase